MGKIFYKKVKKVKILLYFYQVMNGKISTKLYELFIDRSWQHITFEKRPVAFVKIVGTSNTANEV
jgi:hypothetical protein